MSDVDRVLISLILCLAASLGAQHYRLATHPKPAAVVVRVTGGVAQPQIVRLPHGARVVHAITICGGFLPEAITEDVPLARLLEDGENLTVPTKTPTQPENPRSDTGTTTPYRAPKPTTSASPSSRLDLNSASFDELQSVPGIGPALAQRILEARESKPGGYFRSLEDLTDVRGIKGKTLERLRPHIKIEGS